MDNRQQYEPLQPTTSQDHVPSSADPPVWRDSTAYLGASEYFHDQALNPAASPLSQFHGDTRQDHFDYGLGYAEGGHGPAQKTMQQQIHEEHPPIEYKPSRTPQQRNSLLESWGWEFASLIFSILCIVAMSIILFKLDRQLLSSWNIVLSPNTVISVLSTVSKATMILPVAESISQIKWLHLERNKLKLDHLQVFDEASRGPAGALKFFWFGRRTSSYLAYVGCVITIAAIALDPFTQQILSYDQAPTLVDGVSSSVTRSQAYDNQGKGLNGVSNVMSSTRDPLLQQAAISGLYNLVSPAPFACPGSNCTYPTFTSLGISGQCSDVTAQTVQHCIETNVSIPNQLCNYTFPSGYLTSSYAGSDAHNGFFHTTINSTMNDSLGADPSDSTFGLLHVGIVTFTSDDLTNNMVMEKTWQNSLKAFECSYELCAYTYSNWTSANGTIKPGEMVKSSLNSTGLGPIFPLNATSEDFPKDGNRSFEVNYYDSNFMSSALKTIFDSSGIYSDGLYLQTLYNSPNLTDTVANIAEGMSYRMLSGPNATTVQGVVFASQTYIHVHWPWLTLSVVLLMIACFLFGAVVVETEKARQRAWKSSLAPLLYSDVMLSAVDSDGRIGAPVSLEAYDFIRKKTIVEQLK